MYRIDGLGSVPNQNGVGKNGFSNGDPAGGVRGTEVEDTWLNELQEELANLPESVRAPLIKGNRAQVLSAVKALLWPMALSNWSTITVGAVQGTGPYIHRRLSNGRLIAHQANGGANFYTSDDGGSTWTARTKGGSSTSGMNQYADTGSVITVGEAVIAAASMFVQRSIDGGNTWTRPNVTGLIVTPMHATNQQPLTGIAWSPTLNLYVGASYYYLFTSPDGLTWTFRYNFATAGFVWKVIWTGTSFIAVGQSNVITGLIARSTDGVNWTPITVPGSCTRLSTVDVNTTTGRIIVGGDGVSPDGYMAFSDNDGVSFTALVTANGGGIAQLNDGVFLPTVVNNTRFIHGIGCDPAMNTWVAVTSGPHIITSSDDGESWARRLPDSSAIVFAQPCGVAMGSRIAIANGGSAASVLTTKLNRY